MDTPPKEITAALDAAWDVVSFVKMNEYPKEGTEPFHELTGRLDRLEVALKRANEFYK